MMLLSCLLVAASLGLSSGQLSIASYDNCETLGESRMQVAWTVNRAEQMIHFLLCGCAQNEEQSEDDVYVAFGLSADATQTSMLGADATVAWVNRMGVANAVDYHLSGYTQCVSGEGACPDMDDRRGGCTNDVYNISGSRTGFTQCVAFTKPFGTADDTCDLPIDPDNQNQYIVWGVGGLGTTAFKHFARATASDPPIHLGRSPAINSCSTDLVCPDCPPFIEKVMDVRDENATFMVSIGPNGQERGYMAIAAQSGWGNSIYINGTLIPRLVVQRYRTYTFVCETGNDPDPLGLGGGNYHPLYITDSRTGGRLTNSARQQSRETVYAGFNESGGVLGIGPYCELRQSPAAAASLSKCGSFDEYLNNLERSTCRGEGSPGVFTWTPDDTTPDTVYYQCATHQNFGYEITVMGSALSLSSLSASVILLATAIALLL